MKVVMSCVPEKQLIKFSMLLSHSTLILPEKRLKDSFMSDVSMGNMRLLQAKYFVQAAN